MLERKMKAGMYELVIVVVFLLVAGMLWALLGFGLTEIGKEMEKIIPNTTAFGQTPEQINEEITWIQTAFFIYLFFVAIISIIWAIKKTQVGGYE